MIPEIMKLVNNQNVETHPEQIVKANTASRIRIRIRR
ncbi:hypothetical protein OTUT144_0608 [Orientia tsutsugamushi str. UT144]|uniref:Uncharacterized protein n=1 Tax=Orientia tsutsugamushi str. UT144 TaxID=1441384 RepID=A0A0F3RM40_ORITS|nr:hypothetical protein OTUT144_0608 [Orientia tsutsugamushi str. UT144]